MVAYHTGDVWYGAPLKGNVECEHLPQDNSEGIHVSRWRVLLTAQDLWGHPVRCTNLTMIVCVKLGLIAGKSKVAQFHGPVVVDEDILTFQITVVQLLIVEVEKCDGYLFSYFGDAGVVNDQLLLMQQIKETAFAHELRNHIEIGLCLLVQADSHVQHDVGMAQLIEHFNLLYEVFKGFSGHVPLTELLYSYSRT